MHPDRSNISGPELWWSIPALLAFVITLLMIGWTWRSFGAIRSGVRRFPKRYRAWGPRWNFALLMLAALICFGVGWLGYFAIGVVAMLVPPPLNQANQTASTWLAWLLIGMEIMHACAQGLLWAAMRSLASQPIVPRFRQQAVPA